jgi:hypothetical protein
MAGTVRQTPEGFLTMAEARVRLGVSKMTLAKLVRAAGVKIYEDPRDARMRLLSVEDVDEMARPTMALKAILERWQENHAQTDEQLAGYLQMPLANLSALKAARLKTIPGKGGWRAPGEDFPSAADLEALAVRYGADVERLFDVFMGQMKAVAGSKEH